jgi:hypothetical protein
MSNSSEPTRSWEIARYVVELHWHAPRTWGERNLPHAGRFYAWALFDSPSRKMWTYAEATGAIGAGGVETTELAILAPDASAVVPQFEFDEPFQLSRAGIEHVGVAAHGRLLQRKHAVEWT